MPYVPLLCHPIFNTVFPLRRSIISVGGFFPTMPVGAGPKCVDRWMIFVIVTRSLWNGHDGPTAPGPRGRRRRDTKALAEEILPLFCDNELERGEQTTT